VPSISIEQAIYNLLVADSGFAHTLYWNQAPEGASLPYVVFWQIDDTRDKELLSYWGGSARLQFDFYDTNWVRCADATADLVESVKKFRGLSDGYRIHGRVSSVLTQPANIDKILHRTVDVIVRYTEED